MGMFKRNLGGDSTLIVAAAAIIMSSFWLLDHAIMSPDGSVNHTFAYRQIVFAVIGIGIAFGVSRVPIQWWQQWWPHAIGIAIVSVVAVRFFGTVVNGSRRWLDIGPVSLQPSEVGKVLALIALAGFLSSRAREIRSPKVFLQTLGLVAIPGILVFVQPDFGTAQVYGYLALGMLFFAGARWVHFAVLGGSVVMAAVLVLGILPAMGVEVLHDYQINRLTGFLDPEADAQGTNYQTIQAKIAIGSGQLAGRAGDEASQVQQGFLPEPQTDFIYATLVERTGFIGGAFVLALYLLLLSRILAAAGAAVSFYGRLIAGGVAMLFFAQVCVNVGMVVGVLPVTGVPLPMFSYGGSSLWTNMAALGLVAAVLREGQQAGARYQRRTGRPVGGFGSLRATSRERSEAGRAYRPSGSGSMSAQTPLTGGTSSRSRLSRATGRGTRRRPSR